MWERSSLCRERGVVVEKWGERRRREMRQFALIGAPGVGKGTFAKIICSRLGLYHISVGDIVRNEIERKTPQGIAMSKYTNEGRLIPDQIVCEIVFNEINKTGKVLLDGFPR